MLYSPRRVATAAASVSVLLGSIVLPGCGSYSNATITHNPPLTTFGGRSTARSAVQSAILVGDTSTGNATPGGPTPAGIMRRVLDMVRGRHVSTATGPCVNGKKSSQAIQSGSTTTTTDLYYDALCATLEEEEIVTIDTLTGPTTTGTGSITTYDQTGTLTSYHNLTLSSTNSSTAQAVVYNDAASATVGGTVIAAVGATCTGVPNSATMTCTAAAFGTSGGSTFGQQISDTGTAAATAGANNTVSVGVTFFGAGITGITQSAGNWVVLGASGFNTGTGTYAFTTTGATGSGLFSLTDSLYTYTVTGNLTATGMAVTIVRNADPIATATVDKAGNGTINYADGTSDVIWAGVVGA